MARETNTSRDAAEQKNAEEGEGLLSRSRDASPDGEVEDITVHQARGHEESGTPEAGVKKPPRRQSSFAQPRAHGAPRRQQRVRFDIAEPDTINEANGHAAQPRSADWLDDEDYMASDDESERASTGQRAPLLTGIQAPAVTLANEIDINPEDLLESARPKSGLRSAFMNMANSIIGAGIIGQPYAFKQAGLLTGVILLVVLTITVDWTIRLIVTNSKLSGADSFQATMEKCFGRSGLIAISVAQWAFAFGGMVAFCIIIGDTIPRVLGAAFPGLYNTPILWLLTDRRAIIVLFVLGLSYPLSLYRDIAMVHRSQLLLRSDTDIYTACKGVNIGFDLHDHHSVHRPDTRTSGSTRTPIAHLEPQLGHQPRRWSL